jgi:hypothetical protein
MDPLKVEVLDDRNLKVLNGDIGLDYRHGYWAFAYPLDGSGDVQYKAGPKHFIRNVRPVAGIVGTMNPITEEHSNLAFFYKRGE